MVHLKTKAAEIVAKLSKEGFNGIRFHTIEEQETNLREDFDTQEEFDVNQRDYITFLAGPEYPRYPDDTGPYVTPAEFNSRRFIHDLKVYVQQEMGEGVTVIYREGCDEFECQRKSNG